MSEHTPEPWELRQGSGNRETAFDIIADGRIVAHVAGDSFAERRANARLLVQAPALLKALEAAYPILCGIVNEQRLDPKDARYVSDGWRVKELVRAAIKEAKPDDPV